MTSSRAETNISGKILLLFIAFSEEDVGEEVQN